MNENHKEVMEEALDKYYSEIIDIANIELKENEKYAPKVMSILAKYAEEGTDRNKKLVCLCETEEFRKIQDNYCEAYMYQAIRRCNLPRYSFKTARSLAIMFDTAVHHGALIDSSVNEMYDKKISTINSDDEKERLKLFIDCMSDTVIRFQKDFRDRCYYYYDGSTDPHDISKAISSPAEYGVTDNIIADMPSSEEADEHIISLIGHVFH